MTVVVAAVVERNGRFLVTRRIAGTHLEGYWEFPGGKVEAGEDDAGSLVRELREELDVAIRVGARILTTRYSYEDRTLELRFYECALLSAPRAMLGQELRWVGRGDLRDLPFPPADAELITLLTDRPDLHLP